MTLLVLAVALAGGAAYAAGYHAARALRPQGLDRMPVKLRDAAMAHATASEREEAIGAAHQRRFAAFREQQFFFAWARDEARRQRQWSTREPHRGLYVVGGRGAS